MDIEHFRDYCLSKPEVEESFPFGDDVLVFKVQGKMFCLTVLDSAVFTFNVKCNPEHAIELRERYNAVQPGYHMNKKHWNTVFIDGTVSETLIREWIDNSYGLVAEKLTKAQKKELGII